MCESRAVPSGKVYRQLFDAQVQLSRSLLAGRKDTRTDCLSAEDSNTHCSTTSRLLCSSSSRGQQVDDDDDVVDVSRLPDTVVVDRPSSDIIERLTEKKHKKHKEALKQLDTELTEVTQVCEAQVRRVSQELLSSLQEVDLRLDTLKDRMEQLEQLDHVSLQEVCDLWEQVEKEVKLKKMRIMELNHKLTKSETQRTDKIRAVLKKHCHLLEKISFLLPPDVHRLIHNEATMLNQSLLANRRSVARLLLLLQEENLQHESLLHLHWEDCMSRWRRSRVTDIIYHFRSLCSSDADPQLMSVQQLRQTQQDLTEQRRDLIYRISSLVPPTCSTALVSDWFCQLTAVNQQIDSLHADFLHQLRCCYEQTWQDRLAEVERCTGALSALQLSEEEVNDVVSTQLLTLIGRSQSQDEERLAALDVYCDSVAQQTLSLSRCLFVVMRGAALLWETHSRRLEKREEEVQHHLDDLRRSQQRHIQRKKVQLDDLLAGLRQEGTEDALETSLEKTVLYLQEVKHSCQQCVSDQWEVLDRLPSLFLEELLSYSSSLSSFYHLRHTYTLSPEDLQNLHLASTNPTNLETSVEGEIQKPEKMTDNHPISCQKDVDPAQPSQDWLTEAESSLLDLCDICNYIEFTSSKGVTYTGPAFRCPVPDLPDRDDLQQETHLSLFPVELLTQTLSRTRTLFLDHLEQRFHDVLSSAIVTVTDRKEAVCLEQELQLQQLNPQQIQTHVYQSRLAELQLHRQHVDVHCGEVLDVLTSCRTELQELQTTISRKNHEFTVTLSNMEDNILMTDSSRRLEAVSSTLQDCLDQHIKHTQRCQTTFRKTLQIRLEEVRHRTAQLLSSFRLFSEGGDFALQEVKMFQRRLKEETKQISVTEESIYSELEAFESKSLQQVKEVSGRFEEKLSSLRSEVKFMEKIQKIISSTQVHIKAEAASSNQQQSVISSRLPDGKHTVSPDQVCSVLSSVIDELKKRRQYLDFELDPTLQERKQVRSPPPPGLLQPSRTGVDLLDDPVVGIIKSLNRFCVIQEGSAGAVEREETGGTSVGQSPVQRPQQRSTESVSALRGGCRSIRTDRRFQIFGPKPETEQSTHAFSSTVNAVLWKANDVALWVSEDFYRSERLGRFQLVPGTLNRWAESMQQRLLGYQEQARRFLSTSREDLVNQLSVLEDLLHALPSVLISNYEQQKGVELREEVGGVQKKLEETLAASEQEKTVNVRQLRASLREDELRTLISREELRQQQLHSAICCSHLELQQCVRVRGEEFVTSLASLTEKLLYQLDDLLTPAETEATSHQNSEDSTVTMETGAKPEQKPCTGSRTWSGISYLSPPTNSTADPWSSVTIATTASITTTRCTLGHLAVIEQRDTAVERFKQLFRLELLRSEDDKRKQLSELQSWNTHWRQQIHTLKRHTPTLTH
ncbi:coiled-coil domain-containing protein 180 [Xiphias gladius]|uniref:coiled-coil domain-containing protein 180 n=1 Tax=Xiphias gladius TaxID=8245 RepID=UPI001A992725|nr:coiled-coil domain-containing protein 180 [Xiphias gladius]